MPGSSSGQPECREFIAIIRNLPENEKDQYNLCRRWFPIFSIILYSLTAVLLGVSFFKDRRKTLHALKKAWKAFENILPQFLAVLLLIGLLLAVLTPEMISGILGRESGWLGMMLAAVLGSITLIPAFIAFPLAAALLRSGAGIPQIAVFISTLMMVGVVTLPVEIKYFGKRAALVRNGLALVLSILVAMAVGGILS